MGVGKAQCRGPPPVDLQATLMTLEFLFTGSTIVADRLDVQQTSVGREADLTQRRQVMQPSPGRSRRYR